MKLEIGFVQRFAVLCVLATTGACGNDKATDAAVAADLVLRHGYVYTVDAERSVAEAVAVSGGRIVYVGSDAGVADLIGTDTRVIDLQGRMLMPGFQDSHVHPIGGGIEAAACDLNGLRGLPEYRSTILEYATNNPDVPWILGGGWAMSVFGPGGAPSKDILDELVPDRPVFLSSQDGHTGWANSAALAIAGIDSETPDPVDGRIDRDPVTGEPIGSLQEGAKQLVSQHIPETSRADVLAGLRYSIKMLNGYGITSIQDASVSEGDLQAYAALDELGELSLRVVGSIWWENDRGLEQIPDIIALRDKYTAGLVDAATVKVMQDGVMENYTAVMLEPYLIPDGSRGIPMIDPELLKRAVSALDAEGFQVHFHAIGDGAVRQTLDAVEEALIDNGDLGHRHHISHLQMIDPQDIPRFRELQVIANFQPLWAYPDEYVTELTIPFIGEKRARWMYPIKSVLDTGATVAFGSDWSVSTANPFPQIETAISRKDADNDDSEILIPQERIDLESALAAFTINAAFTNRNENDTGSIEVGKFADLVVLDQNLFEIEVRDISETRALMTLFEGRVVHDSTAQ
jgi:predicted amidohydrolase YtcJ